ncbi:unique cartilage matrix-associated protein-like, partial [Coregonus clupeaformis]|uniref:unique cartilage matrix-associated protein-like n=1 Tax=Coregonus clupeaformis TaxID=59861 RepID=UPI001E1C7512
MSWTHLVFLSLLATLLILTLFTGVESASVRDEKDGRDGKAAEPEGSARRVFMPEADATNFFKKRSRRSAKHEAEVL